MFASWLAYLSNNGGLEHFDTVLVMIDEVTWAFFDADLELHKIISSLPFQFNYYRIPQPLSQLEGSCQKYTCNPAVFSSFTTNLYIDLDYLVLRSLRPEYSSIEVKNTLLVQASGNIVKKGIFGFVVSSEITRFFDILVKRYYRTGTHASEEEVFYQCVYKAFAEKNEVCLRIYFASENIFTLQELAELPQEALALHIQEPSEETIEV